MDDAKKPPITSAFGKAFRSIRRRERFLSPALPALKERMFDALTAAAIAKCVDFNVAVNRTRKYQDEEFVFVSSLRGICEDLISLAYMQKNLGSDKEELTSLLIGRALAEGIQTQREFFSANNPFQPVLSPRKDEGQDAALVARRRVREFWAARCITRRDGPTMRDMAADIGLLHTYEYIYFAASNFVHFNPQSLLRMGWGNQEGPFSFSTSNISKYYKDLASFYGSLLFIAYHSAFPASFTTDCSKEAHGILSLIDQVHRWPEIVTFEEMNQKPPLYLLTHAMRRAFSDEGAPKGGILEEVRNLGDRLSNAA
ncbi:DUF5677 domain-containing protein [Methylobacterium sp. Leaf117]|uniref:DUF5677 domain-containing protein n=1 Tax=Methylobacterium sp. Leaf117 TaxID=1736260 RepID=UPI000AAAC30C|nr:DUF5677 domain-containing protein [Methylobacterium sp. Leaf117]